MGEQEESVNVRNIPLRRRRTLVSCDGRRLVHKSAVGAELDVGLPVVETCVPIGADAGGLCAGEGGVDESTRDGKVDEKNHVGCVGVRGGVANGGGGRGY